MAQPLANGPVLFCFDGSDGSRAAMKAAAVLISRPVDAVVITVWETVCDPLGSGWCLRCERWGCRRGCRGRILCRVSGGRGCASGKGKRV